MPISHEQFGMSIVRRPRPDVNVPPAHLQLRLDLRPAPVAVPARAAARDEPACPDDLLYAPRPVRERVARDLAGWRAGRRPGGRP